MSERITFSYQSYGDIGQRTVEIEKYFDDADEGMLQNYINEFDYFLKAVGFCFDHLAVLNKDKDGRNEPIKLISNP